jgi:hypothetical protein
MRSLDTLMGKHGIVTVHVGGSMTKFKKRYVLGEGYPLLDQYKRVALLQTYWKKVTLSIPSELERIILYDPSTRNFIPIVPKYRLILERVDGRGKK